MGFAVGRFLDDDVRHDALGLDRAARRRVVARRGQLDGGALGQGQHGLDRALAEGLGAHHHRPFVVLQGAGDDFRGRGRAAVDQHHHRHGLGGGGQALQGVVLGAPVVVLGGGVILVLGILDPAIGGHHQGLGRQEGGGDADGAVEQAARVVAQVEHQALQVAGLVQFGQLLGHRLGGVFLELGDADVAVAVI